MPNLWLSVSLAVALGTAASVASAQQQADRPGAANIFVNGMLTVPGAPADSETAPSTVSDRNAASDKLPIAAFRLKHLTDAQRREIAQTLTKQREQAIGPAGARADYVVGSQVFAPVALQELAPLPEALVAKLPELSGTGFMQAGNKLLLVDLDNSLVVGILDR
jgi:hypothetical protein